MENPAQFWVEINNNRLTDGSELAIVEERGQTRAYLSRLRDDYSDRVDEVPIPGEMRARLELVFGQLRYRGMTHDA